ncbi:hypothetical protein CBR_g28862 [Chara braunii]|uniref:Reverse transcriptase domain-containing protein n=1 Tax=Chara braunii TaxID=69332 RepID=A0A388LA08_CHABU|nr:hypothetical protein CBR_g28862 [Chara braunii]|eukprot:GBG79147.1 hypothetical protein CBR_g28862 [Chara braunii]
MFGWLTVYQPLQQIAVEQSDVRVRLAANIPRSLLINSLSKEPQQRPKQISLAVCGRDSRLEGHPTLSSPDGGIGELPHQQATSADHVSRTRQPTAVPRQQQGVPGQQAPDVVYAFALANNCHEPEVRGKAYQARMLARSTETKKRADDVATAAMKKVEEAEKACLLAIEQQRQNDEAATKAADEERVQRREKIFSGEQVLLTMAADWRAEAENGKIKDSVNKIALLSHLTDLLATCITQQEDIHNLNDALTQVQGGLRQLEQRPVAAPDARSSNTSDRLEALEMDVGSLKDGVQLQQTTTEQLEQRICTAANNSSSEPRETTPKFDGQELFCNSMKTDPIPWFRKFELTVQLHYVKEHKHHAYLYSRSGGVCQAWLDNLLSEYGVVAADLHTKISWDDLKAAWHKPFQVDPSVIKAMDKLMVFEQGMLPSVDWIAKYQRLTSMRYGHFEWVVMPFGLTNAPTTFQAAMTNEFRAMLDRFVLVYFDDILVCSRTLEDHLGHLRRVLETLRLAKYKANRDKCEFVRQELEYLGHFVTPEGISPLSVKIQAIQEWPEPWNVTDVHSFLGLAGYYHRFIKGYSKIAAQLTKLQCEDQLFDFGEDVRESFLTLEVVLLYAEFLCIYDPLLPTRVTTDASGYGIGAVLEQHDGVDWHPVEYFSKKVLVVHSIDDARMELLAFVHTLKRWRHFLLGRSQFRWVTDNNPLVFYKTQDTVSNTIVRWMAFIDQFDFFSDHIVGKSNRFVDALSRRPDHCTAVYSTFEIDNDVWDAATKPTPSFVTTMALISQAQFSLPPQTDGQTERAHQTAQVLLPTLIRPNQKDWVEQLPDVELAYNSIHPAIGMSPFEFEHGSSVTSPLDTIIPRATESDDHLLFLRRMQELLIKARDQMAKTQQRMIQQANRQRLPCPFRAYDLVWVSAAEFSLEQDISRMLLPKWMGPWPIVAPARDAPEGPSFTIQVPAHLPVYPVFHCSTLALYTRAEHDDFPGRRSQDPPSMDDFQEFGDIISQRRYGNGPIEYLVHFAYCTHRADRWLTGAELQATAPDVFARYERKMQGKPVSSAPRLALVQVPPSNRQLHPRPT